MLTRIYIDNFRCFVNFEYRPERKQLLLGANGSGKSSLFTRFAISSSLLRAMRIHSPSPHAPVGRIVLSRFWKLKRSWRSRNMNTGSRFGLRRRPGSFQLAKSS